MKKSLESCHRWNHFVKNGILLITNKTPNPLTFCAMELQEEELFFEMKMYLGASCLPQIT